MSDNEQWYTNKELYEQLNAMQGDFKDLRFEMRETRNTIKKYNGLREELGNVQKELRDMKSKSAGRKSVGDGIQKWGGWIFGLISIIVLISTLI